jgi:hypothetical protein
MVRGLERRVIFRDDRDRADFVARVARLAEEGAWTVYAWALLPNHAPLRVRTGSRPLARSLRSLIVGDVAVYVAFPVSPSNRSHSMRATRPRRPGWDIGGSGQAGEAGLV